MKIAVTILQLLSALVLILIVLFQSGKSQGLSGAIGGIALFCRFRYLHPFFNMLK